MAPPEEEISLSLSWDTGPYKDQIIKTYPTHVSWLKDLTSLYVIWYNLILLYQEILSYNIMYNFIIISVGECILFDKKAHFLSIFEMDLTL